MTDLIFRDRRHAGRDLGVLMLRGSFVKPIVFALPPGGVPVAIEVARTLDAPLDVVAVGGLALPEAPRTLVGALAGDGSSAFNEHLFPDLAGLEGDDLRDAITVARRDACRRERHYRHNRPAADLGNRDVILVSDGMTTGASMLAAAKGLRHRHPARLFAAVPASSRFASRRLADVADEVYCLENADQFLGPGCYYMDFAPLREPEVCRLLDEASAVGAIPTEAGSYLH